MNVIVLMAIGDKYKRILNSTLNQFEAYAFKCNAALEIITSPLDSMMNGDILRQKLLIPKRFSKYQRVAFMDLDILISNSAPSIFDSFPAKKGFGAVLDPIGEEKYFLANKYWFKKKIAQITPIRDRFINEGFSFNQNILGIINGGIWVANPSLVGDLFENYYYENDQIINGNVVFEEIPMSFLAQDSNLFFALDKRFNDQLIYFSCEKNPLKNIAIIKMQLLINRLLNRNLKVDDNSFFLPCYRNLIEKQLKRSFILHFSGGFPIPNFLVNSLEQ